ncbi:membrane hypothetical protein [uncultured Thiomicrorhabdus sp.]
MAALKILHDYGFNGIAISFWVYALMFIAISAFLWRYPTQIKQNWLALLGILLFGGGALLAFNTSMIFGDVIRAMVLFYLLPLWGLIGGRLFLGEKSPRFAVSVWAYRSSVLFLWSAALMRLTQHRAGLIYWQSVPDSYLQ